jgi:transcription-repair coupling factor (superfamily II helicase)
MVTEAVAELKGETPAEPVEVKIDVPIDAFLPGDYVQREDLRLEAYRRLAAVTSPAEVDDVQSEWEDRYGPVPDPALALLAVARLRVGALRAGITEVSVAKGPGFGGPAHVAKLSPVKLPASKVVRLQRLYKGAVLRAEAGVLQLPIAKKGTTRTHVVEQLTTAIDDLWPAGDGDASTPEVTVDAAAPSMRAR